MNNLLHNYYHRIWNHCHYYSFDSLSLLLSKRTIRTASKSNYPKNNNNVLMLKKKRKRILVRTISSSSENTAAAFYYRYSNNLSGNLFPLYKCINNDSHNVSRSSTRSSSSNEWNKMNVQMEKKEINVQKILKEIINQTKHTCEKNDSSYSIVKLHHDYQQQPLFNTQQFFSSQRFFSHPLLFILHSYHHNNNSDHYRVSYRNHSIRTFASSSQYDEEKNETKAANNNNNNNNNNEEVLQKAKSTRIKIRTKSVDAINDKFDFNKDDKSNSKNDNANANTNSIMVSHWIEQIKSIPNIITISRMISSPIIAYWIISNQINFALIGCSVAAFSDVLDGYIARNYNMSTTLGTYLDPLADKVLINVLSISLWIHGTLPTPLVALWISRDIGLIVGAYRHVQINTLSDQYVMDPGSTPLKVNPTTISRINTAFQFLTISVGICIEPLSINVYSEMDDILLGLCWMTGGTTIGSGISYLGNKAFSDSGNIVLNQTNKSVSKTTLPEQFQKATDKK